MKRKNLTFVINVVICKSATKSRLKIHDKQVHELVGPNKETRFDATTFLYLKYDKEVEIFYCTVCKEIWPRQPKGKNKLALSHQKETSKR